MFRIRHPPQRGLAASAAVHRAFRHCAPRDHHNTPAERRRRVLSTMDMGLLSAIQASSSSQASESDAAIALCQTLRTISSTIKENLAKQLKARLQAQQIPAGGAGRSLDKSGAEIQAEALQIALLMSGRPADEAARTKAIAELHARKDDDPQIAGFLQYWATLGLVAGVYAPGAGIEVRTAYMDWYRGPHTSSPCALHARVHEGASSLFHRYRGPPGRARYMPGLAAVRADLEAFILQARPGDISFSARLPAPLAQHVSAHHGAQSLPTGLAATLAADPARSARHGAGQVMTSDDL